MDISQLVLHSLLLTVIGIQCLAVLEDNNKEDYYWEEYTGVIPSDAIPGGTTTKGETTYIVQGLCGVTTRPFDLVPNDPISFTCFDVDGSEINKSNKTRIKKVLRARTPEHYEWIKTDMAHVRNLINKHLVPGGNRYEILYGIGRIQQSGRLIVGTAEVDSFIFFDDGKKQIAKGNIEVLSYNPRLPVKVINKKYETNCERNTYNINFYC